MQQIILPQGSSGANAATVLTSPVTVGTTETSIVTLAIPASVMTVGTTWRLAMWGVGTTVVSGNVNLRVRLGTATLTGNVMTSINPVISATGSGKGFFFNSLVTVRSIGTSGSGIGECAIFGDATTPYADNSVSAITATSAINTLVANLLEITGIISPLSNTITVQLAEIFTLRT